MAEISERYVEQFTTTVETMRRRVIAYYDAVFYLGKREFEILPTFPISQVKKRIRPSKDSEKSPNRLPTMPVTT